MSDYIFIGKVVNTHALKGEVRIISDFKFKDKVFIKDNYLYLGHDKCMERIETYRQHKQYDMVKFVGIDNINDVLKYKGVNAYILKTSIKLNDDEVLIEDLIGMSVMYDNNILGTISDYENNNGNEVIKVNDTYLPYNKNFIDKILVNKKIIYYKDIGGLL